MAKVVRYIEGFVSPGERVEYVGPSKDRCLAIVDKVLKCGINIYVGTRPNGERDVWRVLPHHIRKLTTK